MKKVLFTLPAAALMLAGCVAVQPASGPGNSTGDMCPPGQAKKGNCYPGGGFCPPGLKKQGRCPEPAATSVAPVEVQVRPVQIKVQ
ncbi:MAG: hypothetical protein Q4G39_00575 [Brachymonas sp.]|nr:hypothetical protein [Brachymonas sp.]